MTDALVKTDFDIILMDLHKKPAMQTKLKSRCSFKTLPNIYDGGFMRKNVDDFHMQAPSSMFKRALNTPQKSSERFF